jgi:hypothetical protein
VTVQINLTNGQTRWGPGTGFTWQSQAPAVVSLPVTVTFQMVVLPEFGGVWSQTQTHLTWLGQQSGFQVIGMNETNTKVQGMDQQISALDETNTRLTITVRDSEGAVIDSGQRELLWNTTTGLPNLIQASASSALTAQQNTWLQQAGEGIMAGFQDALGRLVHFPLGEYFLGTPPPQFVVRSPAPFDMVGEFDISVPIGTYGLIWTWSFVPIGIGFNPGIPRVYHAEMVTLTEFHLDPGTSEFAVNRVVSQVEGVPYQFVQPQPTKLHIEVLPGVRAAGQWLILPSP